MLIAAGLQVPVMPFVEVAGRAGGTEFWHSGPICVNTGVTSGSVTIAIVAVVAHWPADGVKVYVTVPGVAVLIVAGLQVPVMPFVEVPGRASAGTDAVRAELSECRGD